MPNWFQNAKNQDSNQSRYIGTINVDVSVPMNPNFQKEQQIADLVVRKNLDQIEGNASLHSGVESNITFYNVSLNKKNG